jgi:putative peptidoglycan lipid II flippase
VKSPPPPNLARGALSAGLASLAGRVSGLLRDIAFAAVFGAGHEADAWNAASRVPNLFRELLAEGSLTNVLVPLFAEAREKGGRAAALGLINAALGLLLVVLGLLTALFVVFSRELSTLVAGGYAEEADKIVLTGQLTALLAPVLAGASLTSLLGGLNQLEGRFTLPALAPALINVAALAATLGGPWIAAHTGLPAIHLLAIATSVAGLGTAAVQLPGLWRLGYRLWPRFAWTAELRGALPFFGAGLVGAVIVQWNLLIESQIASGLGEGPLSHLLYGFRLVQLPQTVVAGSVATATLAALSLHKARGEAEAARAAVTRGLELNSLLVVPAAVGMALLAEPLIALIYERGAFGAADTAATATVVQGYAVATIGICAYRVLLPIFFALGDPYLPMKLGLGVALVKWPLATALTGAWGLIGLPLSHAITVSLEVLVLLGLLGRRLGGLDPGWLGQQARIVVAAAAMGLALLALRERVGVLVACGLGALIYGLAAGLLGVRELGPLLRRFRPPPPPPRP